MLKHTKCLLGATFFYLTTVTVVYGNTPRELCQDHNNVLSKRCEEVRVDENYEVLLPEFTTKSSIINIVQDPSPLPTPIREPSQNTENQGLFATPGLIFQFVRNGLNNLFLKKPLEEPVLLASVGMNSTNSMLKSAEKLRPFILNNIAVNIPHLRDTKLAMIPGSYATLAQSESTQQTDNDILITRNFYIDIRPKITYLKTFSDSLEAMKKLNNYPYNIIRDQVRSDLKKNIKELSTYEILGKQFYASIPVLLDVTLITDRDAIFIEFARQQIEKAEEIPGLEKAVSDSMNQNLDDPVELITSLVNLELKLSRCRQIN